MTRTYLKSSSLAKPSNENVKLTSSSLLLKPVKEVSLKPSENNCLNSPEIVLKSKRTRKPLLAIGNVNSPPYDDSLASNRSSESPPSLSISANDTFDKLLPKAVDPFDDLFNNVNKKAVNPVLHDISSKHAPSHQDVFCSGFSTPSDAEFSTNTTDTSYQAGLFSSFSKQVEERTPKLKKKSHRSVRTKKLPDLNKPRENILSETLSVQVVFEGDFSPRKKDLEFNKVISSLATLVPESPPLLRGRTLTALSVATSTPVLGSRSDQNLEDSSPKGHGVTLSPVRDVIDDVFLEPDEGVSSTSPVAAMSSKDSKLPSDEFYDATPPPQKSFVNRSRGNKKFGGPAASIMDHIGWKFSMHTIQAQDPESVCETSLMDMEKNETNEITVNIACVCGSNEMTSSQVIQCDHCALWFHTDCIGLSESLKEEIESLDLDWFCRACISEAQNNPEMSKDFTISTPYKMEESSLVTASSCDIGTSLLGSKDIQPCCSLTEISTPVSACAVSTLGSDDSNFVEISSKLLPSTPELEFSVLATSSNTLHDDSSFSNNPSCALQTSVPPIPSLDPTTTAVTTPANSDTSLLSLTLQLEQQHLAQAEGVQDASLLFVKPAALPKRRKGRIPLVTTEEEIQLKPGKNWRRSLSLAKKSSTSILEPRPTLSSVEILDPTPVKTILRRSTRLAPIPSMEESIILPTPLKSVSRLESMSRTSFCVVPSMSRLSVMDSHNTRLSVLHSLSKTLLVEKLSETLADCAMTKTTPLDKLLATCSNNQVLQFDKIYPSEVMEGSKKVGEGAFGEVFLIGSLGDDRPVLKVVPIDGDILVNGEVQTKLEDMLSEVIISDALSKLRIEAPNMTSGFVEVRGCHVFQGAYPPQLLQLWDAFDDEHKSENDRPDNLPVDQLYIALEFNNAGKDLEKYTFTHASQALQAWKQVAHTLAVAEEELLFEHRDLHWGNVLVKETKEKYVKFTLGGDVFQVETGGVKTSIIDFSLSRLSMDKVIIFNNLSEDPSLFTAKGKGQEGGDYQFDIYREMKELNGNKWEPFNPMTNLYWLDYMLEKMIGEVYYSAKKTGKPHKSGVGKMRKIRSSLKSFSSVAQWVRREGERVD